MTGRIDTFVDDRGLAACFQQANVHQEWFQEYIVDSKNWEREVVDLCESTSHLKGNKIAAARIKSAWEAGHHALKMAQQAAPTENLDELFLKQL